MPLTADFQFSQGSLQDYIECARRFQLRYLERRAWPAIEAEPALLHERQLQQGLAFHRLVHQHIVGIDADRLERMAIEQPQGGPELERWWRSYRSHPPADLPDARYPEITLSAPLGGYRLLAKYDLVAVQVGQRAVIVDWKTTRGHPQRQRLARHMQTRVYPYLLTHAGHELNGARPVPPQAVEMIYWFANFPQELQRFAYSEEQYAADGDFLLSLVNRIAALGPNDFPQTEQVEQCRYCRYRSLCQRGTTAGLIDEDDAPEEADLETAFDFDEITEIPL
ncbi:MAG: PD-(D/E)XK nuclease family protein [Anaerolineales bacterium]|nr:PD-(D/E)XK nuclease family protein [Anaerolineales bacterium]